MARVLVIAASALVLAACGTTRPLKDVTAQSWSGDYRFQWQANTQAMRRGVPVPEKVQIRPVTAVSVKDVPGARLDNGPQWAISFVGEAGKPLPLRPFKADGYRDFGWEQQRASGQIDCLESSAFMFLCRVPAGATVSFGRTNDEQLTSKTGLFGVILHQGSFELTPLE